MESLDRILLPEEPRAATKHVLSLLLEKIQPLLLGLRKKLSDQDDCKLSGVQDVYTLCSSQICKCIIHLLEVFKLEVEHRTVLQDSRQYLVERLSWCISKLISIDNNFDTTTDANESCDDSINVTTMYFVNWIDHTFEVLGKLAEAVYKKNYKESDEVCEQWKKDMVECVSDLHISTDELLLSAMTLCKYCLAGDQHIVKARCQVVLRETKSLLSELIEGDLSSTVKASIDTLKLPIMPSNVNVLIDVLKDVLYSLETNTNTALLALVVNCYCGKSPIQVLREHFKEGKGSCSCIIRSEGDEEDCSFVKEFDLYNERLLQIGNFAVSCSSDQNRILSLRSGLASLEALDPHLVPALMMSPDSLHSTLLIDSWTREVNEIRDNVFLIVDPAAFAEKSKQMMHQKLVSILKEGTYNEGDVCSVIDIGCVVSEFFKVYDRCEPDALTDHDQLMSLVADLNKVQNECKIVNNLLTSNKDFKYDIQMPNNTKEVSTDQLSKRLKLLYTLVTRIHNLIRPKDNEDNLFTSEMVDEEPEIAYRNTTHTVVKSSETYVHAKRVPNVLNASRSMFARTNIRSSTRNFPLSKLTKRFKTTICAELSFSAQLDRLLTSDEDENASNRNIFNNNLDRVREKSVLYNFSPLKRSSLRKAVLNKHWKVPVKKDTSLDGNLTYNKDSIMDETASLQITDILNQMNDMTNMLSNAKQSRHTTLANKTKNVHNETKNVLRINVNNQNTTISKNIWNIPVNSSTVEMPLEDTNLSQPSNVNTLERIHDLDFVESKLNSLKSQLETSL